MCVCVVEGGWAVPHARLSGGRLFLLACCGLSWDEGSDGGRAGRFMCPRAICGDGGIQSSTIGPLHPEPLALFYPGGPSLHPPTPTTTLPPPTHDARTKRYTSLITSNPYPYSYKYRPTRSPWTRCRRSGRASSPSAPPTGRTTRCVYIGGSCDEMCGWVETYNMCVWGGDGGWMFVYVYGDGDGDVVGMGWGRPAGWKDYEVRRVMCDKCVYVCMGMV